MTVKTIAHALCAPNYKECAKTVIPPWFEGADETPVKEAFAGVGQLRRQRDELIALWPHKKTELEHQFNDTVTTLARDLHEFLYELTA